MTATLRTRFSRTKTAARKHFEKLRWPDGPDLPALRRHRRSYRDAGQEHRPGLYKCRACHKPFTATMGTLYEKSHIPLHKWLLATHLWRRKKGMSAHQLWRMLGFGSYRTAWFMAHRIREGMAAAKKPARLAAKARSSKTRHSSAATRRTSTGASATCRNIGGTGKEAAFALVERGGNVRSHHVPEVSGKTLRPILRAQVEPQHL